jgi:hypothetical protein
MTKGYRETYESQFGSHANQRITGKELGDGRTDAV